MSFESNIGNCPVIDDNNFLLYVDPLVNGSKVGRGLIPRDFSQEPYGSIDYAEALPLPLIPESEWTDRIEEIEKNKSSIPDVCDQVGLKVKNQAQTNYCWINAPVHCLEIMRVMQGQPYVELSPASVGAIIKNFRNVGGWGTEGTQKLASDGAVPSSLWPNNAIDRQYNTPAANAERVKYQVDEWWELKPRSFAELATCLLINIPVAIGLNWWGHEVTAVKLVKVNGLFAVMIDNSWGTTWGDNGRGVLTRSKATPDDAIAPRLVTAA